MTRYITTEREEAWSYMSRQDAEEACVEAQEADDFEEGFQTMISKEGYWFVVGIYDSFLRPVGFWGTGETQRT